MVLRPLLRFSLVGLLISALPASAALERGPYLQMSTDTSVVVMWQTSGAEDGEVKYGPASDDLSSTATGATGVTAHEVSITGLTAGTTYFYSVGDPGETILAGADANHFFRTHPTPGTATPMRIWATADGGQGNTGQSDTRDAYLTYAGSNLADVWIAAGDMAYLSGLVTELTDNHFTPYQAISRNTVLWPTLGSHDVTAPTANSSNPVTEVGVYFDAFTLPTAAEAGGVASGSEAFYSFDYGDVHFVSIDTNGRNGADLVSWVTSDLCASTATWKIVYWYHTVYTTGSHDSDNDPIIQDFRDDLVPTIELCGADLFIGGYSHVYERSFLVDGHYGLSTTYDANLHALDAGDGDPDGDGAYSKELSRPGGHGGTVYVTNGVAATGKVFTYGTHPTTSTGIGSDQGGLVIDIDGNTLDGRFVSDAGTVLDHFQINKSTAAVQPWSPAAISPASGSTSSTYTPNGDTQSPTINASRCEAVTLSCFGYDMTGSVQTCSNNYAYDAALSTLQCQDILGGDLDCADTHSLTIDPVPSWMRVRSILNSDSSQFFQLACAGSLK